MLLVLVDANGSKYSNLALWSYQCDPCGQIVESYVAHQDGQ